MFTALMHLGKEKATLERRVVTLQAQLKHFQSELQWQTLTQQQTLPGPATNSSGASSFESHRSPRAPLKLGVSGEKLGSSGGDPALGSRSRLRSRQASCIALLDPDMHATLVRTESTAGVTKFDYSTPKGQEHAVAALYLETIPK